MTIRDQLQATLGDAYTLERELGGGGMSRVFVAMDTALGRRVVVKVLSPELTAGVDVERFNREILLAAKLQHPHIVPVLTAGSTDGLPWFTMPFVDGQSLGARISTGTPLVLRETVGLLRDVAKALTYAHEQGVVHRDIKPDNILLADGTATVADFGIAKALSASRHAAPGQTLTQVGMSIGTPTYMSPEQAAGDSTTDHRTDLYAFGCVAYELLAGRPPFVEESAQRLLAAHMATAPQPIGELAPDTPAALANLVMACLAKDADARPQTAREVVEQLDDVGTGSGSRQHGAAATDAPGALWKALGLYALATGAVAVVAKAAIVGIGLPQWVLPGALAIMALGLPVLLWTGYVRHVAGRDVLSRRGSDGKPSAPQGTLVSMALKASPTVTWQRVARGGALALGLFVALVGGFMGLRAMGIGPEGSLVASGELATRDRLVMADFTVNGADVALGRVVSDAVRAGIAQSNVVSMMTLSEINSALRRMEQPADAALDLTLARSLATREGVKAVVDGDVTAVDGSYIVSARLVTADSGRELASYRETANGADGIIPVADELSRKLRSRMGESLRTVNAAPPLSRVTTASLEALRLYSAAARANGQGDALAAVREARAAVAVDSLFAEGWRLLATAMGNAGFPQTERDVVFRRAFALRDRLPARERDYLEASFYGNGSTADRARAIAAYERLLASGDTSVANNLALQLSSRQEFARAESLLRIDDRLSPDLISLNNLIDVLENQGKWQARDSVVEVIRERFPQSARLGLLRISKLYQQGDVAGLRVVIDSALADPDPRRPSTVQYYAADIALMEGRVAAHLRRRAQAFALDSVQGIRSPPFREAVNTLQAYIALDLPAEAQVENAAAAWREHRASGGMPAATVGFFLQGSRFAQAGAVDISRELMADYERVITDSAVIRRDMPMRQTILAEVALREGRFDDAAREFRRAELRPDGPARSCTYCVHLNLFRVFATAGMRDSALAQYEAYRTDPATSRPRVGPDLVIDIGSLEAVARLYDARGDTARAVDAYRDFVTRLERADPILQPRVVAARARLAELTPVERVPR